MRIISSWSNSSKRRLNCLKTKIHSSKKSYHKFKAINKRLRKKMNKKTRTTKKSKRWKRLRKKFTTLYNQFRVKMKAKQRIPKKLKILKKMKNAWKTKCFSMILCSSWSVVVIIGFSGVCDITRGGHANDMYSTYMLGHRFPDCCKTLWMALYVFSVSRFVGVSTSHPAR